MIEDIEYLENNCEKDSIAFYIDSTSRDKQFFPTPSEFTVNLDHSFKFTYGFDILDASIPTTMYVIDIYNSYNAFTFIKKPANKILTPLNYFKEIKDSLIFSRLFENKDYEIFILVCDPDIIDNYMLGNRIYNNSDILYDYYVAIRRSTMINLIQVKSLNDPDLFYVKINDTHFGFPKTYTNIIDIINDNNYGFVHYNNNTWMLVYYEFYRTDNSIYTVIRDDTEYYIEIINYYKAIEIGNYDISALRNDMNTLWNPYGLFIETTTSVETKQGKYRLYSSSVFIYNAQKSNQASNLGFDLLPTTNNSSLYNIITVRDNTRLFLTYFDGGSNWIYAPGLVNLLGERYVILRCKEIEDHLLGSYAYMKYSPGIGMFKLAAVNNDITNLRFDFVNLIRKPFHPIGKLTKLSFRFETSTGILYDFKGVNLQMLFMIKFYVPSKRFKFEKSILNPNYDPNFMRYMATSKNISYKESSDYEQEFLDSKNKKYYIQRINDSLKNDDELYFDEEE